MEQQLLSGDLAADRAALKALLPAEDILFRDLYDAAGTPFVCIFADVLTDKDLLAEQVIAPLQRAVTQQKMERVLAALRAPELRTQQSLAALADEVLAGNPVLLWEGGTDAAVTGQRKAPARAVTEPPSDIAIKGPREGFLEDMKSNAALVRKRLKTGELLTRNDVRAVMEGRTLVFNQPIMEKIIARFSQAVLIESKRQEALLHYEIDEYDERFLRHLALGYTKEMISKLRGMPFGVKSLEKRQNDLINRLFTDSENGGINATRLVVRALQLRILDIDHLEPDDE